MGRGTLSVVRDESGDRQADSGLVGGPSERFGMDRGNSGWYETGRVTLGEVRDG